MKKIYLLLLPLFLLLITGCGSKSQTTICTKETQTATGTLTAKYTLVHDDKFAKSVIFYEELLSDDEDYLNEVYQETKNLYTDLNDKYGGYDINIRIEGNKIISDVKLDYTKMDVEKMLKDNPGMKSYTEDGKMLYKILISNYKNSDFTCK